jgi:hypothetical protein
MAVSAVVVAASWPTLVNPAFEPDDYRYLAILQRMSGRSLVEVVRAGIVENRWDHLWWMAPGQVVRFFRPTVLASYAADALLYGDAVRGFIVTNVLIHIAAAIALAGLLVQFVGRTIEASLGTVLFAAMACHGEVLWYVAGRTDSLAGLAVLLALLLHARLPHRPGARALGPWLVFGCGLFTKEIAVVIPFAAFALDRALRKSAWNAPGRKQIWIGYGVVFAAYLSVRVVVLGGGQEWVFPYTLSPLDSRFPAHLFTQGRSYLENLFFGATTPPFLGVEYLGLYTSSVGLAVALGGSAALLIGVVLDSRGLFFLVLGVLAWLPTSVVYVSERYLYVPSMAVAGLTTLLLAQGRGRTVWLRRAASGTVLAWCLHQGMSLHERNRFTNSARTSDTVASLLEGIRGQVPKGSQLVWLDFPFGWLDAQFMEPMLQVQLQDPELTVSIITQAPLTPSQLRLDRMAPEVLRVSRNDGLIVGQADRFARTTCHPGVRIERPALPFRAEVVSSRAEECTSVDFQLPLPLEQMAVIWFRGSAPMDLTTGMRFPQGSLTLLDVPPFVERP